MSPLHKYWGGCHIGIDAPGTFIISYHIMIICSLSYRIHHFPEEPYPANTIPMVENIMLFLIFSMSICRWQMDRKSIHIVSSRVIWISKVMVSRISEVRFLGLVVASWWNDNFYSCPLGDTSCVITMVIVTTYIVHLCGIVLYYILTANM